MNKLTEVKCYDTFSKEYITVEVSEEVATYYKRSYWREDMQRRRFDERVIRIDSMEAGVADFFLRDSLNIEEILIEKELRKRLHEVIDDLESKHKEIVVDYYFKQQTLCSIAKRHNISASYMSKLVKRINSKIRESMQEFD